MLMAQKWSNKAPAPLTGLVADCVGIKLCRSLYAIDFEKRPNCRNYLKFSNKSTTAAQNLRP